jgi:phosphatidylglycerophosphate synthase
MFDARLRPLIDPPLNRIGAALAAAGVSANAMTLAGAAIGIGAGVAIGFGWIGLGLALIIVNRLFDGLDGPIARARGASGIGGYLDIVADFVFYVAVPLGFAFFTQENMAFALILVASFTLTGVSFLAFAVVAAERGLKTEAHGRKSFFYSTGLAEGGETIAVFILMCLLPGRFPEIATIYAVLCAVTVVQRTLWAARVFS